MSDDGGPLTAAQAPLRMQSPQRPDRKLSDIHAPMQHARRCEIDPTIAIIFIVMSPWLHSISSRWSDLMLAWQVRVLNAGYSRARERARHDYYEPNNNGHCLPLPC